uniref:Uncharacterized protein n=1 Tax=Knipowitschia caucasica TaxID=637954 RepID=A0AAV2LIP6_KNICA
MSPDNDVFEKRRRTFEDEGQHRYQLDSADSYRQPSEHFSEGYSYKRAPEESGHSKRAEVFEYGQYEEEPRYRPAAERYPGREKYSQDVFEKRTGGFSRDHKDFNLDRFPPNGSSRQMEPRTRRLSPPPIPPPPPRPAVTQEKTLSKGFQRFLDVLNMGVNVETLNKIAKVRQPSPDRPWTEEPSHRPQFRPETERPAFTPQSWLYSSNGKSTSEERVEDSQNFERRLLDNRPASPANTSFEDDSKRKEMNNVLQAIGIKLGFEELGQMSSRIQERLYGKKETETNRNEEQDGKPRRGSYVPKRRSSSIDSAKNHSYGSQKEESDFSQYTDTHGSSAKPSVAYQPSQMVSLSAYALPNHKQPPQNPALGYMNLPPNMPPMFMPPFPLPPGTFPHPLSMFNPMMPPTAPASPYSMQMPHPFLPNMYVPFKNAAMNANTQQTATTTIGKPQQANVKDVTVSGPEPQNVAFNIRLKPIHFFQSRTTRLQMHVFYVNCRKKRRLKNHTRE